MEIATGLLARLAAEAAASPHAEICGLLFGAGGRIEAARPARNVSPSPADGFEIDPAALIAAHRAARAGRAHPIGHYHSHPGGSAHPSARDRAAAEPGSLWLIVGTDEALLWRAEATGVFAPVPLVDGCQQGRASSQGLPSQPTEDDPMTDQSVEFASLLCSRLCHDLLSPVGALANGLELLADETDPAMRERCMELVTESARISTEKLKFYRLAFGVAGGLDKEIETTMLRAAVAGVVGIERKISLDWLVEQPTLSKRAAKVLLNLSLIAGEALVRGGTLTVGAEEGSALGEVVVRAEGERIAIDPDIVAAVRGETAMADLGARTAAAWLVAHLAGEGGGSVQVIQDEGVLLFGASLR